MRYVDKHGVVRFLGPWRGRVTNVDDPNRSGAIKALVADVLGSVECAWALPKLPPNLFGTPQVGDQVWIEFEQGDVDRPIWAGYAPSAAGGGAPAAPTAIAQDDATTSFGIGKGGGAVEVADADAPGGVRSVVEPVTTSQPKYPEVRSLRVGQTFIEVDGTEKQERIQLFHPSGAYIEIGASGQIKVTAKGSKTEWVKGAETKVVTGQTTDIRRGPVSEDFSAGVKRTVKGNVEETVTGKETRIVKGSKVETRQGSVTEKASGLVSREAGAVEDVSLGSRSIGTMGSHDELVSGAVSKTIVNKDFPKGQKNGYKVKVLAGNIAFESATGDVEVSTPLVTLLLGKDGDIRVGNTAGGALHIDQIGRVALGSNAAELVAVLDAVLDALIASVTATAIGPQPLSAVPQLAAQKALLQLIKGSL